MLGDMSGIEMGPVRSNRLHEKSLGLGASFSGNGNGRRELSILGRRRGEIDLSGIGKRGEGEEREVKNKEEEKREMEERRKEELTMVLEGYGLNGEVAEELAGEMLASWEREKEAV